jgi:hypothetical protein
LEKLLFFLSSFCSSYVAVFHARGILPPLGEGTFFFLSLLWYSFWRWLVLHYVSNKKEKVKEKEKEYIYIYMGGGGGRERKKMRMRLLFTLFF